MTKMRIEGEGEPKKEDYSELANRLEQMQAGKNKGMGVSCVREVVTYLRLGDWVSAQTVAITDGDKIRNYPDINAVIQEELLKGHSLSEAEIQKSFLWLNKNEK